MGIEIDYFPGQEDETGPFRQSERLDIYNKYIDELMEKGLAYEC
jgi:nondiscriminating glutamyl-tRNA synthetase